MHNTLESIIKLKLGEVAKLKQGLATSYGNLDIKQITNMVKKINKKSLKSALSTSELSIIAEVKRKSPSAGMLADIKKPTELVNEYIKGGAAAISVLTEPSYFAGSIEDLKSVAASLLHSDIPVLRKDFIIDESQIIESALSGADAILLIVAAVKEKTAELLSVAKELNLDAIVEVHNKEELAIAIDAHAEIIGVNNRNLQTLAVDPHVSLELAQYIPQHILKISESGVNNLDDIKKIKNAGFNAVLIGGALVQSADPAALIAKMRMVS